MKKLRLVEVKEVDIPTGATHYDGSIDEGVGFYKCSQIGAAGDHWWMYLENDKKWHFVGHTKPHFIKELHPQPSTEDKLAMAKEALRVIMVGEEPDCPGSLASTGQLRAIARATYSSL